MTPSRKYVNLTSNEETESERPRIGYVLYGTKIFRLMPSYRGLRHVINYRHNYKICGMHYWNNHCPSERIDTVNHSIPPDWTRRVQGAI